MDIELFKEITQCICMLNELCEDTDVTNNSEHMIFYNKIYNDLYRTIKHIIIRKNHPQLDNMCNVYTYLYETDIDYVPAFIQEYIIDESRHYPNHEHINVGIYMIYIDTYNINLDNLFNHPNDNKMMSTYIMELNIVKKAVASLISKYFDTNDYTYFDKLNDEICYVIDRYILKNIVTIKLHEHPILETYLSRNSSYITLSTLNNYLLQSMLLIYIYFNIFDTDVRKLYQQRFEILCNIMYEDVPRDIVNMFITIIDI